MPGRHRQTGEGRVDFPQEPEGDDTVEELKLNVDDTDPDVHQWAEQCGYERPERIVQQTAHNASEKAGEGRKQTKITREGVKPRAWHQDSRELCHTGHWREAPVVCS